MRHVMFEFDFHGRYVQIWANDESLLGRPMEELLGKPVTSIVDDELGRSFAERIRRVITTGRPESLECELIVDGGERSFIGHLVRVPARAGSRPTAAFVLREVTQSKPEWVPRDGSYADPALANRAQP